MESQDTLVIILLIVFWGFSLLYEKLKRKQKAGQKKGFTLKLLRFILAVSQYRRETNGQGTLPTEPESFDHVNDIEATLREDQDGLVYKAEGDLKTEKHVSRMSQPSGDGIPVARDEKITVISPQRTRKGRKVCRKKMREAIIWIEILGPPVALQRQK